MRWASLLSVGLFATLVGGCVDMNDNSSTIVGTSGDVATEPGDYVGYRVVTPCEDSFVNVGVIGLGSIQLTEQTAISTAGTDLVAMLRDVPSIWGNGVGLSCEPGLGITLYTDNWRDVDDLIVRIGDYLRERDVALQVGIGVGSVPVPVAN